MTNEEFQKLVLEKLEKVDVIEAKLNKIEIMLEHDIKPKIEVLFDGHKLLRGQLDRIDEQVSKHDEFIIKRIK